MKKKDKKEVKLIPWLGYETRYHDDSEYGCPVVVWLPDNTKDSNKEAWLIFMVSMNYIENLREARAQYKSGNTLDLGDGRSVEFELKASLTLEEYAVLDKCCVYDCGRPAAAASKYTQAQEVAFKLHKVLISNCRSIINETLATDRRLEKEAYAD